MIKIHSDIFVFKNVIGDDLIERLLKIPNKSGRVELYNSSLKAFYDLNFLWKSEIEDKVIKDYTNIENIKDNVGFEYIKTFMTPKWKSVYLLHYNQQNTINSEKNVHFDFSGFTMIGCLNDGYVGGDLCFPRQNLSYHLERGDIIVFSGGITNPHYVSPILSGFRNVVVGQTLNFEPFNKIDY